VHNSNTAERVPLQKAARELGLTGHGLLKLLQRTNSAIRSDGHWYVHRETLVAVAAARRALGIARRPKTLRGHQSTMGLSTASAV
jgi:hypothetical protein